MTSLGHGRKIAFLEGKYFDFERMAEDSITNLSTKKLYSTPYKINYITFLSSRY
jgi:hypothetical protein